MIYRQYNYKEPVSSHVQIGSGMYVARKYILKISETGLVTFVDGSAYQGNLVILTKENLL